MQTAAAATGYNIQYLRRMLRSGALKGVKIGLRSKALVFGMIGIIQVGFKRAFVYNLYIGTVFQQQHLTPMQVVLLMRGICKGESSKMLAAEFGKETTILFPVLNIFGSY